MGEEVLCRRLSNGVLIPNVCLGTWQLRSNNPQTEIAVKAALSCGYRGLDTAWVYDNEDTLGKIVQQFNVNERDSLPDSRMRIQPLTRLLSPDDCVIVNAEDFKKNFAQPHGESPSDDRQIFVTTKIWIAYYTPEGIESQVKEHLQKFNRSSIDLILLHWPGMHVCHRMRPTTEEEMRSDQFETRKTCWLKMEELYWGKKLRAIGVSNYLFKHLNQLCDWVSQRRANGDTKALYPMVDQIELSVFLQPSADLVELCRKHNIMITSYSTLGSSSAAAENMADPTLTEIAAKYHDENNNPISTAAIMQRWALESGYAILPRSSNPERIRENLLNSIYRIQLSDADLAALNGLNANRRSLPCPDDVG